MALRFCVKFFLRWAGKKEHRVNEYGIAKGMPMVYLGEAGGARMSDIMGAKGPTSFGAAGSYDIHDVIDPRTTRDYIIRALEISRGPVQDNDQSGIGEYRLANWPTQF